MHHFLGQKIVCKRSYYCLLQNIRFTIYMTTCACLHILQEKKKKQLFCILLSTEEKKMRNKELKLTGCAKYVKYVFGSNFKCVVSDKTKLHNTGSILALSIQKKKGKKTFLTFFADRFGLETCFTSFQYSIRKEIFKKKKGNGKIESLFLLRISAKCQNHSWLIHQ